MSKNVHRQQGGGGATRPLLLALALLLAAGLAAGCGGDASTSSSSSTSPPIASVGGQPIGRPALEHWIRIENARLYGLGAPLPDPPRYLRCAATAAALRARSQKPPLPVAALRRRCARAEVRLRDKALEALITALWIEGEAARLGIHASRATAEKTYTQLREGPTGSAFLANYRSSGMTRADELRQLRLEEMTGGLREKLGNPDGTMPKAAIAAYRRRWRARTVCEPGYLMHDCRNAASTGSRR